MNPKDQKGFLLIEIILAIAIFAVLAFVALSAFIYGRDATVVSGNNLVASEIVNEAIEAIHNISDSNYLNLSNYTNGTQYYLNQTGTQWSLSSSPTLINGTYTPAVVFSAGPNSVSRQVTVTVTWKEDVTRNGHCRQQHICPTGRPVHPIQCKHVLDYWFMLTAAPLKS